MALTCPLRDCQEGRIQAGRNLVVDGVSLERCQPRPEFLLPHPASHEGAGEVPVARATLKGLVGSSLEGNTNGRIRKGEISMPQLHNAYFN